MYVLYYFFIRNIIYCKRKSETPDEFRRCSYTITIFHSGNTQHVHIYAMERNRQRISGETCQTVVWVVNRNNDNHINYHNNQWGNLLCILLSDLEKNNTHILIQCALGSIKLCNIWSIVSKLVTDSLIFSTCLCSENLHCTIYTSHETLWNCII